jgi:para-nitrobenzyl esterase
MLCVAPTILGPALSAEAADTDGLTVRLRQGAVHGAGGEVRSFKGVPYAAPPMGPLRWRPPQSAPQWTGVREAAETGAPCMQPSNAKSSEDCLYLNIWTPAKGASDRLPAMVWIHVGVFVAGSGSNMGAGGGEEMARKGVVVVTTAWACSGF